MQQGFLYIMHLSILLKEKIILRSGFDVFHLTDEKGHYAISYNGNENTICDFFIVLSVHSTHSKFESLMSKFLFCSLYVSWLVVRIGTLLLIKELCDAQRHLWTTFIIVLFASGMWLKKAQDYLFLSICQLLLLFMKSMKIQGNQVYFEYFQANQGAHSTVVNTSR